MYPAKALVPQDSTDCDCLGDMSKTLPENAVLSKLHQVFVEEESPSLMMIIHDDMIGVLPSLIDLANMYR